MKPLNIYIHIPFCFSKCPYCSFYSCTNSEYIYDEYFKVLNKEIEEKGERYTNRKINTIYIGGGTPNLVNEKYIVECIRNIKKNFNIEKNIEIGIELYPQYITREKLISYKNVGINRLSIGLQTTHNDDLKTLTRRYTYEEFLEKYNLIKTLRFNNIGIDLIFSYPTHTLKKWKDTLNMISKLDIQHISAYSLEIEEGSTYYKLNNIFLPSEYTDRVMYHYVCKYLNSIGIQQYEISNFAREGYECNHNLNFWKYEDYLGLGAGAYSRIDNTKSHNPEDLNRYINMEWDIDIEKVTKEEEIRERKILGLRLNKGIEYDKEIFNKEYMIKNKDRIYLNSKGRDLYNLVIENI